MSWCPAVTPGLEPRSLQPTGTDRKLQFVMLTENLRVTKAAFKLLGKPWKKQGLPLSITHSAQGLLSAFPSLSLQSHPRGAIRPAGRVGVQERHPAWLRFSGTQRPTWILILHSNRISSHKFNQSNQEQERNDLSSLSLPETLFQPDAIP